MLHLWGIENAIRDTHKVDKLSIKELTAYYVHIFSLFYADEESKKWLIKKIREDVPALARMTGIDREDAAYQWAKAHYNFIKCFLKEKYVTEDRYYDKNGELVEEYKVYIEEKEGGYVNPLRVFE